MIKLHIQVEPFNGKRFDFIEIEVNSVKEIPGVYKELEQMNNVKNVVEVEQKISQQIQQPIQQQVQQQVQQPIPTNIKLAYYKGGSPVMSKDRKHLNVVEYHKGIAISKQTGKRVWEILSNEL